MKTMKLLPGLVLALCLTACVSKEKPTEIGRILTSEEVVTLAGDNSNNGKQVAVKGYPAFSRRVVKIDARNFLSITTSPGGDVLIRANVFVSNADKEGTTLIGTKPRNLVLVTSDNLDITQAQFILDDYSEPGYGEYLFSGTLICDGDDCYLDNVSIHKAE